MTRAGDGEKIAGQAAKRAVSEHGKGDGFFGIYGKAELIRESHFNAGKQFAEPREQQPVVRSAAGNNQTLNGRARNYETAQRIGHRTRGELRCGAEQVFCSLTLLS